LLIHFLNLPLHLLQPLTQPFSVLIFNAGRNTDHFDFRIHDVLDILDSLPNISLCSLLSVHILQCIMYWP